MGKSDYLQKIYLKSLFSFIFLILYSIFLIFFTRFDNFSLFVIDVINSKLKLI